MDRKILRVISVLLVLCVFAPLPQVKADDFYKGKTRSHFYRETS
jgi:hypothetical protein